MTIDEAIEHVEHYGHLKEESDIMFERLRETYAKPVEMTQKQRDFIVEQVELGNTTDDIKRNVPEQTVKESNEQAANLIVRAFNRIASVFR